MKEVDPTAYVSDEASIEQGCVIKPNVRIYGDVSLAKGVLINANSLLYGPITIGEKTFIDSNVVLGYPAREELESIIERGLSKLEGKKPVRIGKEVIIRSGCAIYSDVIVGDRVHFGHNVLIREGVVIGDGSLIGTNVVVDGKCKIGHGSSIQTGAYISKYSTVADHVFLGPNCVLINDKYLMQKKVELRGPTIKTGASVGANAVIFPDVTVGEGAVIGAGSVVMEDVPPKVISAGVPAKVMKEVPPDWQSLLKAKS